MIEQDEIWVKIPNSLHFAISNKGRIKRLSYLRLHNINKTYFQTKENILTPSNNNSKKYWRMIIFYENNVKITESIHRLVAKAFIPNLNNLPQVNHIDGNKNNNCVENLEWCTNIKNMNHRYEKLKFFSNPTGEKCNFSKLKQENVFEIAEMLKLGFKVKVIAEKFKVCCTTISEIKNGRSWRHLNLFKPKEKKSEKYFNIRYVPTTQETEETL